MEDIKQLKILVVDDEAELLRLVESILRKEGFCRIYTAEDGVKAMELFENVKPDAAILDVMLPEIDGFTLLQRMRTVSQLPVLFLSAKGENEDRLLGLGIGADDYIVKPFLPKELTLRLCAVLRRVYQPKGNQQGRLPVFELGQARINLNTGTVLKNGCEVKLTAKEYMLLKKLYENAGRIVTSDSLCYAAWGDDYYGYENTLMVHIRRIREKIEPEPSAPRYLMTVRGLGYKLMAGEKQ